MMKPASPDAVASPDATDPGLFFITLTFKDLPQADPQSRMTKDVTKSPFHDPSRLLQITHDRQSKFYKHVLNQTVPSNHYPSRKKDFPVALSFIDLSGARFHRSNLLKMPHTHSIFIVPPKTLPRFKELVRDDFRISGDLPKTKHIQTFDCQRMPWRQDDLHRVLDYSSKFYRSGYAKTFPEDILSIVFSMFG